MSPATKAARKATSVSKQAVKPDEVLDAVKAPTAQEIAQVDVKKALTGKTRTLSAAAGEALVTLIEDSAGTILLALQRIHETEVWKVMISRKTGKPYTKRSEFADERLGVAGQSRAYQLMNAGRVLAQLEARANVSIAKDAPGTGEGVIRELDKLPDATQETVARKIIARAKAAAAGKEQDGKKVKPMTAREVRESNPGSKAAQARRDEQAAERDAKHVLEYLTSRLSIDTLTAHVLDKIRDAEVSIDTQAEMVGALASACESLEQVRKNVGDFDAMPFDQSDDNDNGSSDS